MSKKSLVKTSVPITIDGVAVEREAVLTFDLLGISGLCWPGTENRQCLWVTKYWRRMFVRMPLIGFRKLKSQDVSNIAACFAWWFYEDGLAVSDWDDKRTENASIQWHLWHRVYREAERRMNHG